MVETPVAETGMWHRWGGESAHDHPATPRPVLQLTLSPFRSRARTNGATQTFRRSSTATSLSQQRDNTQASSNLPPSSGNVYVPPHLNSNYQSSYGRNGPSADSRYSKDQLLDMFRAQAKSDSSNSNVNDLLLDGWTPWINGISNGGWGKRDEHKDTTGPEICWDHDGTVQPMALLDMTVEEKEVEFSWRVYAGITVLTKFLGFRQLCQLALKTAGSEYQ